MFSVPVIYVIVLSYYEYIHKNTYIYVTIVKVLGKTNILIMMYLYTIYLRLPIICEIKRYLFCGTNYN